MTVVTYFPDSNVFLQCKPLSDVDWKTQTSAGEIRLLISPIIQREIDRLKGDGRGRRADRARKTATLFRSILHSNDGVVIVRESKPRVTLAFAPTSTREVVPPADLDLSYADERLVAEILAYRSVHPGVDAMLLSLDIGPLLAARRHGLPCVEVPDDWLLLPEPNEAERKLALLERRVHALESTRAEIQIIAEDGSEQEVSNFDFDLQSCRDFTPQEIAELMDMIRQNHPMATDFSQDRSAEAKFFGRAMGIVHDWKPPTETEIQRYQTETYPGWLNDAERFLEALPSVLDLARREKTVRFRVKNSGNFPAENVIVQLRTYGDLTFRSPSDIEKKSSGRPKLPDPPSPPSGRFLRHASIFGLDPVAQPHHDPISIAPILHPRPRDRHTFYWSRGRPSGEETEWKFECTELRHQFQDEIFDCPLRLTAKSNGSGVVECFVSASNLPEPVSCKVPVTIRYTEGDVLDLARKMIMPSLINIFSVGGTKLT
jgi:hypothetical protein